MTTTTLREVIEGAGYETRGYSGRAMFGRECLGVEVPSGGLGVFIADVMTEVIDQGDVDRPYEIAEAFRGMAQDSMGRNLIVYFPSTPYDVSRHGATRGG